jgi:WD40 repeat protein
VRVWDPATGQTRHTLTGHTSPVGALVVAPDGSWLASASNDTTVRVWDPVVGRLIASLRVGHPLTLVICTVREHIVMAGDRGPYVLSMASR